MATVYMDMTKEPKMFKAIIKPVEGETKALFGEDVAHIDFGIPEENVIGYMSDAQLAVLAATIDNYLQAKKDAKLGAVVNA